MFKNKNGYVYIYIFMLFLFTTCDTTFDVSWEVTGDIYQIEYNMIKVPVPEGGINFPIGINDDDTARVEKAFYISEIPVTWALWDTVSRWALRRDFGYYYGFNLYRIINHDFPVTNPYGKGYNTKWEYYADIPMYYIVPIWLNAFTQWYNEKHGTNLVPVYQDSYGNPLRGINNMDNVLETANPNANGFRLPTSDEWELAARWNGDSKINTVTETINGIDFSNQEINFTTGRSASGARSQVENFDENDLVAVWKNNSGTRESVKSKKPNMLGIYDMSGNCYEITSNWSYGRIGSTDWWSAQCRGGTASADYEDIAIGKFIWANFNRGSFGGIVETSNIGIRLARNAE